ncbi:MAG: TerB family tellurite resistance protein [Candidatus Thiothrix moscowensis]|nr:TerB family tellurite resistance protein [Candidatus Thiothrix moscowensis]
MGFFDSFRKQQKPEFTCNEDAVITLMVAMGSIDGELDQNELLALVGLARVNTSLNGASLERSFQFAVKYLKANGAAQSAVDAFSYLPGELHATALSFACLVTMADGVVTNEEESKLMELAEVSSLSEAESQAVINTCIAIMKPVA